MNCKLIISLVFSLVVAFPAQSDLAPDELVLTVWNNTLQTSYAQGLGLSVNEAIDLEEQQASFNLDATGLSHVTNGGTNFDVQWNIVGIFETLGPTEERLYVAGLDAPTGAQAANGTGLRDAYFPIVNQYKSVLNSAASNANDTVFLSGDSGLGNLGSDSIWGSEMAGLAGALSTVGAPGGANSELITSTARTIGSVFNFSLGRFVTLVSVEEVPNLWSIDFELGTYTYAEVGFVPPIPTPLPAGAWLFFSGLLGFVGFRKVAH